MGMERGGRTEESITVETHFMPAKDSLESSKEQSASLEVRSAAKGMASKSRRTMLGAALAQQSNSCFERVEAGSAGERRR